MSDYHLQIVPSATVLDLRTALMRRHGSGSPSVLGDDHPMSSHVAAYRDKVLVGIGSIHPQRMPDGNQTDAWRLHGVAVEHGHRGAGVGALIVERCLEHAAEHGARVAWCAAPAGAFGFFERFGFRRTGDPIDASDEPQYLLFAEVGPLRRSNSI